MSREPIISGKVIAEAEQQRRGHEKNHGCTVHAEQLVEGGGAEEGVLWLGELGAHQQGLDPASEEQQEGANEIADADLFVIDGAELAFEVLRRLPQVQELVFNQDSHQRVT